MTFSLKDLHSNLSYVSLLIFDLNDLFTDVSGMLRFPTIIVLSFFPLCQLIFASQIQAHFSWVHRYLQATYSFVGLIHFIIMSCPTLSLFTGFVLKFILSDVSVATSAFFFSPFAQNTFSHSLTLSLFVSLDVM